MIAHRTDSRTPWGVARRRCCTAPFFNPAHTTILQRCASNVEERQHSQKAIRDKGRRRQATLAAAVASRCQLLYTSCLECAIIVCTESGIAMSLPGSAQQLSSDTRVCCSTRKDVLGGLEIETTLWDQGVVSSSLAAPTIDLLRIRERHGRVSASLWITRQIITRIGGLEQTIPGTRVFKRGGSEIAPVAPLHWCTHTTGLMS
jgi:hypothetical protein